MRTDRAHAVQIPVRRESPLARFDPEVDLLKAGIRQIAPHLLGVDLVADDRVGELGQNRRLAGARERHELGVVPRSRAEYPEDATGPQGLRHRDDRRPAIVEPVQGHRAQDQVDARGCDTHVEHVGDPQGRLDLRILCEFGAKLIEHSRRRVDSDHGPDPAAGDHLHRGETGTARHIQHVVVRAVGQGANQALRAGMVEADVVIVDMRAAVEALARMLCVVANTRHAHTVPAMPGPGRTDSTSVRGARARS